MNFEKLAEYQILAALERGELDNLEGEGKPLPKKEGIDTIESFGFGLMAKAGALPAEVLLKREIAGQWQKIKAAKDPDQQKLEMKIMADLQMRLAMALEARR